MNGDEWWQRFVDEMIGLVGRVSDLEDEVNRLDDKVRDLERG